MFGLIGVLANVDGGAMSASDIGILVGGFVAVSGAVLLWYKQYHANKDKRKDDPTDELKDLKMEKIRLENAATNQALNKDLVSTVFDVLDGIKAELKEQEEKNTLLITKIDGLEHNLRLTYKKLDSYENFCKSNGFSKESILKDF